MNLCTVTVKKLNNVSTFSRKTVCFGLHINKTCVPDIFPESPLNTDTRIIRTLWHVPSVSVLTGFHCTGFTSNCVFLVGAKCPLPGSRLDPHLDSHLGPILDPLLDPLLDLPPRPPFGPPSGPSPGPTTGPPSWPPSKAPSGPPS